jgi:NADPH-dependent 2,4-dienoyl-CoA reductase/sulfur reductase-like enzyme
VRRYIIVGSGAAGIAAAEAIRCHDPAGQITLLSEEPQGYYSRPGLAYYLTGEINERQLYPFSDADFRRLGFRPKVAPVARIHARAHRLELSEGSFLPYDRLVIATGSAAVRSKAPGEDLKGVVKLDNMGDALGILKMARRKMLAAVVVGGGITALEIVEGLVSRRVKTHYFLRRDRYWHNILDDTESRIVEERMREHGVQLHFNTELAEILGRNGQVSGVLTVDGRAIPCGLVAIAIGVRPRAELAQASGLAVDRGILVDECLQTSHADIFAAGDVAQVFDPFSGKSVVDTLWGPARGQGTVAGMNMVGLRTPYSKPVAFNVTRLAGLTTTIIGMVGKGRDDDLVSIARGDSETWRQLPDAIVAQDNFEVNRLRLLIGEGTLLGAIVMGDQKLSRPIQELVAQQADITPIRDRLTAPGARLADLIADFWTQWRNVRVPQHA